MNSESYLEKGNPVLEAQRRARLLLFHCVNSQPPDLEIYIERIHQGYHEQFGEMKGEHLFLKDVATAKAFQHGILVSGKDAARIWHIPQAGATLHLKDLIETEQRELADMQT